MCATVAQRFERATQLCAGNEADLERAKDLFLEVIAAQPQHFGAWNNLGMLLFQTGYTAAAQTAYTAAISYHPEQAEAHVNLAYVLLHQADLPAAERYFLRAIELAPHQASAAHRGLSLLYHRQGDVAAARQHRDLGFTHHAVSQLAYVGTGEAVELLILGSALEGNIPWHFLLDRQLFQTTILAVEYFDHSHLPRHDLIFNAIGDADLCAPGLAIAARLCAQSDAPVINAPLAVSRTTRWDNAQRLAQLAGVRAPRMVRASRHDCCSGRVLAQLAQAAWGFPLLLRASGFHGGNYFERVATPADLAQAAVLMPETELLLIEMLDDGHSDGLFRKYRAMWIEGVWYPLHLAIAAHWKVHYFSSVMAESAVYRAAEQAVLDDFPAHLGEAGMQALQRIGTTLDLDYCGLDFGIHANGDILVYEANPTMVINPPDAGEQWDYRRAAIACAITAARNLFAARVAAVV